MTEEVIGLHRTGTLDRNRPSNYTQTTPDDCTKKNSTNIGLHPTQNISSETKFDTSSFTSENTKPVKIQIISPTIQLDEKHKTLYAPLHSKNHENHALVDTGAKSRVILGFFGFFDGKVLSWCFWKYRHWIELFKTFLMVYYTFL